MTKRLLALLEVLMAISIICTGYASWSFAEATSLYAESNSMFSAYDVSKQDVTVKLSDFGIEMTTAIDKVGSSQTFQYKTVMLDGKTTEEFTSTSLSILFKIDIESMKNCAVDGFRQDYREESLIVTCAAENVLDKDENGEIGDDERVPKSFDPNEWLGVGYWLTPTIATLKVYGYPNVSHQVSVTINSDGALEMRIPMTELYNLLFPCKNGALNGTKTVDNKTVPYQYLPVELVIDFEQTGEDVESDLIYSITVPCAWRYTFSAQLAPNT